MGRVGCKLPVHVCFAQLCRASWGQRSGPEQSVPGFVVSKAFLGLHRPSPLLAAMFPGLQLPREQQKRNIARSPTHVAAFPTRGSTNMAAISPWMGLVRSPPGLSLTTRVQPTLDESCPETEIRLLVGDTRLVVRSRFPWGARRTGSPGLLPKQVDTVSSLILLHR